jgi:hypothetical protein
MKGQRFGRYGILAVVGALGALAADARAGGCEKDTDCKGERVCVQGQCVAQGPQACQKDSDCPGDQVCERGGCSKQGTSSPLAAPSPPATAAPAASPPPAYPPPAPLAPTAPSSYGYPAGSQPLPPAREHRSAGLMIAGAVMLPLGFLATIAGGPVGGGIAAANGQAYYPPAIAVLAIGMTVMTTGIVFVSIGAPEVPVETTTAPQPPTAAIVVEPVLSPSFSGLRGMF